MMEHHHEHDSHELKVLLKYMAAHNKSHTEELRKMAEELKNENEEACLQVLSALSDYEKGNEKLEAALKALGE